MHVHRKLQFTQIYNLLFSLNITNKAAEEKNVYVPKRSTNHCVCIPL